jgi:transcriptional regulator with XRE-family HTH domain
MDDTLNRISELLDKSGMKKIELLTQLGLSRSAWSGWTSGRMDSYKKKLPEIASIFNVSLDWLSGNEQKNKPSSEEDSLSEREWQLIESFRKHSPEEQDMLLRAAHVESDRLRKENM